MAVALRVLILMIGWWLWLPVGAMANDVRFNQVGGAANLLAISQANAPTHSVHGLDGDGIPDPMAAMQMDGNFSAVEIVQSSSAGTVVAGAVTVRAALSSIDYALAGSGGHQVILQADTGTLTSTISAADHGAKAVEIMAHGSGSMAHRLTLYGGSTRVGLRQTVDSSLIATITTLGERGEAQFSLSGINSSASVELYLGTDATFALNQTGQSSAYSVAATVGNGGSLIINQSDDNQILADTGGLAVIVPDGASVTISR